MKKNVFVNTNKTGGLSAHFEDESRGTISASGEDMPELRENLVKTYNGTMQIIGSEERITVDDIDLTTDEPDFVLSQAQANRKEIFTQVRDLLQGESKGYNPETYLSDAHLFISMLSSPDQKQGEISAQYNGEYRALSQLLLNAATNDNELANCIKRAAYALIAEQFGPLVGAMVAVYLLDGISEDDAEQCNCPECKERRKRNAANPDVN